jgi:hypothetical protein
MRSSREAKRKGDLAIHAADMRERNCVTFVRKEAAKKGWITRKANGLQALK